MPEHPSQPTTRRRFFVQAVRGAAMGGMGLCAAVLAWRRTQAARRGETCINQQVCRGCRIVDRCHLPQALTYRAAARR